MSDTLGRRATPLGSVDPARSRHRGRRSAVALTDDHVVAGTADGTVRALDRGSLAETWRRGADGGSVVSATALDDGVAVGERGPQGAVRVYDGDGSLRWRHETTREVGRPARDTRFFLPFVVDLAASGGRLYAAARRYERRGEHRHFESVVYGFAPDGTVVWRYRTDASPISLDTRDDCVAVAFNRCPGDHRQGLVVLDANNGRVRWSWDSGTDGQRRVGDVSLLDAGAVVTSHADYRGYALADGGDVRWATDLATPRDVDGEVVYAYPNHVRATGEGALFVTGNTYPEEGRETEALHPEEHTAFGYSPDGDRQWDASVGGFANGTAAHGTVVAVPCAQNFRRREAETHGCRLFDVRDGHRATADTEGIVTAAAVDGGAVAAVEEPVVYHDEGEKHGAYRAHSVGLS